MSDQDQQRPPEDDGKPPTFWQSAMSVSAAFFGVQSSRNRVRDFKHGKASHFIILGVISTVLFILMIWMAVKFALSQAAG